jgi:RNA methyltransferase, TrmH family
LTITSPHNRHLTEIRRLQRASARRDAGRFVAEGEDLNDAALAAGISPVFLLCAQGSGAARGAQAVEVSAELLAGVSALGSSTRVIGVYEQRWEAPTGPLALALWGVRDPGNIGTVLRSAVAFGGSCVALGPGCADPYGAKAVRASMGAVFHGKIASFTSIAELPGRVVALVPSAGKPLGGAYEGTVTLLVGGEREGLPGDVVANCHEVRHIPQVAGDSLNAAMAATVALYEATRMAAR